MVSTPLSWDELTDSLEMASFTIDTLPERIARVGDLWTPLMKKGNPLSAILPKEGGETAARKPPAVKGSEATSSRSSAGKRTPRRKATPKSAKRGSPPPAAP
jgi:DNA primase